MKTSLLFFLFLLASPTRSSSQILQSGQPSRTAATLVGEDRLEELKTAFYEAGFVLAVGHDIKSLRGNKADLLKWTIVLPPICERACADTLSEAILPNRTERSLRSTQAKVEVIQQPNTALVQVAPATTVTAVPNPDQNLLRVSTVTNYSELVPTPDDVQKQAQLITDAGLWATNVKSICGVQGRKLIDVETVEAKLPRPVIPDSPALAKASKTMEHCLLRTGFRNELLRNMSGIKGTFSYSQNPQVQQNLLVPNDLSGRNKIFSGQIDFDPSKLFLTGSDWLSAYQASRLYGPDAEAHFTDAILRTCHKEQYGELALRDKPRSGLVDGSCLRHLAAPTGWKAIAAVLVPTVTYSVKTQFDFIKSGGSLVPAPYATQNLGDLTLGIDLTRVIPSTKSRADALTALILARKHTPVDAPGRQRRVVVEYLFEKWTESEDTLLGDKNYLPLLAELRRVALPPGEFDRIGVRPPK